MSPITLQTRRLKLREWTDSDLAPFAEMNADPRVMEHFPAIQSKRESDDSVERFRTHFDEHGFGLWAVELLATREFAGFVGLAVPRFEAPFTPCVEIGWRLASRFWGLGYATEGAHETLRYGFETVGLDEIVSFTAVANERSRRVMEKLGMRRDAAEDFDHPSLDAGDPLCRHVLYRLLSTRWRASTTRAPAP